MSVLEVPGAELYHEIRGSGPVLLFIPGGNGDAAPYGHVANALAASHTVVTYDRRGFSRSTVHDPVSDDERLPTDAEDAARLLEAVGDGPATVFGSSSGAIVGLELLTRHPDQVATFICHEPPLAKLLPDAEKWLSILDGVYETAQREGIHAAMREFGEAMGVTDRSEPPPDMRPSDLSEMVTRIQANLGYWIEHELRTYPRHSPDLEALSAHRDRLIPAGGADSREFFPYRPNTVLAERFGLTVTDFPGGHIGYGTHPAEFSARLTEVLGARG